VRDLSTETQSLIPHYDVVQEVNVTRLNLTRTRNQLSSLLTIPEKVSMIQGLIEDDMNLLETHREIRNLEKSRNFVLKQAEPFPDQQKQLREIFRTVDKLAEDFDEHLFALLTDHMDLARENPAVLVKVLQVILREERLLQRMLKEAKDYENSASYGSSSSTAAMLATSSELAKRKNYFDLARERLYLSLREAFYKLFEGCKDSRTGDWEIQPFVDRTRKLMDLLVRCFDEVTQCFPPKFQILNLYVTVFHESLYEVLSEISKRAGREGSQFSATETLLLVKWVKTFYEPQLLRIGVEEKKPDLIDALDTLIDEFRNRIFKLMDEWATRIFDKDRDADPEIIDGIFYTLSPVTLFTFITQQIELAQGTTTPMMVFVTVDECRKCLLAYQRRWADKLQDYLNLIGTDRQVEIEYIMAQVNNNSRCLDYVAEMEQMVSDLEDQYKNALQFDQVLDGFQSLLKMSRQVMLFYIMNSCDEDIKKLFGKEWQDSAIEGDVTLAVLATINDYFVNTFKGHLLDNYFKKLALETLEEFVERYVTQLITTKWTCQPKMVEQLHKDVRNITQFFLDWEVRDKFVHARAQVLSDCADIVSIDPGRLAPIFESLLSSYPDVDQKIIEKLLDRRSGLEKKARQAALEDFKRKHDALPPPADGVVKETLFTRVRSKLNK
jgi:hypothetical protein